MPLLDHIWPWSTIRRLRRNIQEEYRFGQTCLFMLDQVDPGVTHIRLNGELYLMGVDHCSSAHQLESEQPRMKELIAFVATLVFVVAFSIVLNAAMRGE